MSYSLIQPPFSLDFETMSVAELRGYYRWVLDNEPARVAMLVDAVHATPEYGRWRADFTPGSLGPLGDWFAAQVATRPYTAAELEKMKDAIAKFELKLSEELTDRTFSLAFDVGLYLARVMLAAHPSVHWHHDLSKPKKTTFGRPVLRGFGRVLLDPVDILIVLAYGIKNGTRDGRRLKGLFHVWSKDVSPGA